MKQKDSTIDSIHRVKHWQHRIPFVAEERRINMTPGMIGPDPYVMSMIPQDLRGTSLLDIGAYDGLYSFLSWERGAIVTSADIWDEGIDSYASPRKGNEALRVLQKVKQAEFDVVNCNIYDVKKLELNFDIVLCLGLLYVLPSPWDAIQKLADVTNDRLVIETEQIGSLRRSNRPVSEFLRGNPRYTRSDNWRFNKACLRAMLIEAGFKKVEFKERLNRQEVIKLASSGWLELPVKQVILRENAEIYDFSQGFMSESGETLTAGMKLPVLGEFSHGENVYYRVCKYLTSRKESVTLQGYILSSHTDPVRILSQHSLFSALPGVYPGFVCENILNYLRGRRISLVAYK